MAIRRAVGIDFSHPLAQKLIMAPNFGRGSGPLVDLVTGKTAVSSGPTTWLQDGERGAKNFTGYYDQIPIPTNAPQAPAFFSMGVRFRRYKVYGTGGSEILAQYGSMVGGPGQITIQTGFEDYCRVFFYNSSYTQGKDWDGGSIRFVNGSWWTSVITADCSTGGEVKHYVNGKFFASTTLVGAMTDIGASHLRIGGLASQQDVSDVNVWTRKLTDAEACAWGRGERPYTYERDSEASRFFISRPALAVTGTTYTQELSGELSPTSYMSWVTRAKRFFRWRNR